MSVLNNVIVISLDVHIWSGRKKLRPEDLMASGALPPERLVSLGSKKIFDPDALKPFAEVKREAESLCLSHGVRFLKGFAIPRDVVKHVLGELARLKTEYDRRCGVFLSTYETERERWKQQYPGYERLIETEMLSKESVASKLSFGFQTFCVNEVDGDIAGAASGSATTLAGGLVDQLYGEISAQASEFIKRSLDGREEVTQRFLRPLKAMRAKLAGLAFLDASVAPVIEALDRVLTTVPAAGRIAGLHLDALRGVCALLSDPQRMRRHGQTLALGPADARPLLDEPAPVGGALPIDGTPATPPVGEPEDAAVPPHQAPRVPAAAGLFF